MIFTRVKGRRNVAASWGDGRGHVRRVERAQRYMTADGTHSRLINLVVQLKKFGSNSVLFCPTIVRTSLARHQAARYGGANSISMNPHKVPEVLSTFCYVLQTQLFCSSELSPM